MLQACPTDIVNAPAERVWGLLTKPKEFAGWTGLKFIEGPDHEVHPGDRIVLGAGTRGPLKLIIEVQQATRQYHLVLHSRFPLGIISDEVIHITPTDCESCRVTYN